MYITYHKEVELKDLTLPLIQHHMLHPDIQAKLAEFDINQSAYVIDSNGYYTFLYLDNGDRIDISNEK